MDCVPMTWPIGCGSDFKGVYDIRNEQVLLFDASADEGEGEFIEVGIDDPELDRVIGTKSAETLREELELVVGAGAAWFGLYTGTSKKDK